MLDAKHSANKLEDLTPVVPRENENEEIILKGLSIHSALSEEDALNLLYIGKIILKILICLMKEPYLILSFLLKKVI